MDIFWELRQQQSVARAESAARQSQDRAQEAASRVRDLEARLDRLTLINMALWSLLRERAGLIDEDLTRRVTELDMQDGRLDGKVHGTVTPCPQCGKTLSQKHHNCLFCGWQPPNQDPFSPVAR